MRSKISLTNEFRMAMALLEMVHLASCSGWPWPTERKNENEMRVPILLAIAPKTAVPRRTTTAVVHLLGCFSIRDVDRVDR
ncbi:hypothetical protein DFH29DRAFT_918892, partial [Suillus ampliporus]